MAGTQLLKRPVNAGPGRRARHVLESLARRHRAIRARGDWAARPATPRVPPEETADAVEAERRTAALLAMVGPAEEAEALSFGPCSTSGK